MDPIEDPDFDPLLPRVANPERMARIRTLASAWRDLEADLHKEIREAKAAGHSFTQLTKASGIPRASVQRIVNREN